MYIESVPNRNSPPAILLRESYRDAGKIKKRTIANLSDWPTELVEGLRTLLKGGKVAPADQEGIIVRRALPHGHVAAVLGTLRNIGLDRMLGPPRNRCRDLVIAMIVARLMCPASKLATARMLDPLTASSSLGEVLGLGRGRRGRALCRARLALAAPGGDREGAGATPSARRHAGALRRLLELRGGPLLPAGALGYNRDGKKGKLQIVYGLLCAADGCPVAIEVFEGNTGDPRTLAAADRQAQEALRPRACGAGRRSWHDHAGAPRCRRSPRPGSTGSRRCARRPSGRWSRRGAADVAVRPARHGSDHVARLSGRAADRLPQSRSRARAHAQARGPAGGDRSRSRRHRRRRSAYAQSTARRGRDRLKVGAVVNRHKCQALRAIHHRRELLASIARPRRSPPRRRSTASTSCAPTCPRSRSTTRQPSRAYKSLARVERAFRSLKTVDLHLRPIFHWTTPRVRAHVLLCMLAYHVEYHMRARLAPMLYDETDHEAAAASALPSLPRPSAPKPPGASRPPASPTTACRCTASKACSPTSPPMRGSRRPPRSTTNTSLRSTPGQLRSSSAPSSSSPLTRTVPSKATRARDKQQRAHCLIDSKEGSSV